MGRKVLIARITRAHGMKGEVKVLPFLIKNPEILSQIPRFYRRLGKEAFKPLIPESVRPAPGGGFLIKFSGIEGREAAENLHEVNLYAELSDLPPKEEDEYYVYELVGLKVVSPAGEELGRVVGVMPVGPYDLLEIKKEGEKSFYLPMIEDFVEEIDLEKGLIKVNPPADLIEAQK